MRQWELEINLYFPDECWLCFRFRPFHWWRPAYNRYEGKNRIGPPPYIEYLAVIGPLSFEVHV